MGRYQSRGDRAKSQTLNGEAGVSDGLVRGKAKSTTEQCTGVEARIFAETPLAPNCLSAHTHSELFGWTHV